MNRHSPIPQLQPLEPRRLLSASPAAHTPTWFAELGDIQSQDVSGLATDSAGNCYVAGQFSGTVDFNPARRKTFALTGTSDTYLAKYNFAGRLVWARAFATPTA